MSQIIMQQVALTQSKQMLKNAPCCAYIMNDIQVIDNCNYGSPSKAKPFVIRGFEDTQVFTNHLSSHTHRTYITFKTSMYYGL